MKGSRCSPTHSDKSSRKNVEKAIPSNRSVDVTTIENNPKINAQLVSDFYRLVDASHGAIQGGHGANYGLSHPLDSKVVPTDDPRQNEEGLKEVKKTKTLTS